MEKHHPDLEDLYKLEYSLSMDNLPDGRAVKCYLNCLFVGFRLMREGSSVVDVTDFIEIMNYMTREEQGKYLRMSKKCLKKYKDPCESAYQFNICMKRNSNEDFYILWREDLKPGPA